MKRLSPQCQSVIKSGALDDKISIFTRFWTVNDCNKFKKSLFIFGDNDIKMGCGGQAIIRNCSNAIGIPTKKAPNNKVESFYIDAHYEENCKKIIKAVENIIILSEQYEDLVFPMDGFGQD